MDLTGGLMNLTLQGLSLHNIAKWTTVNYFPPFWLKKEKEKK